MDDVTSYVEAYHTWGPKRANRPEILFQYDPPTVSLNPTYNVQAWYDQNRIVLGYDGTPVLCWSHLPATISSRITGQEIEALLRLDRRSRLSDLMARMPKKKQSDDKVSSTVPRLHYTHFSKKQRKARLRLCCRSWSMYRASTSKVDRALELYLSQHFAQLEATRLVKGFHDLNKEEQDDVKALCKEMQGSHHTEKNRCSPLRSPPGVLRHAHNPNVLVCSETNHPLYAIKQRFVRLWQERNSRNMLNVRPLGWPEDCSENLMLLEEMLEMLKARKRYEDETVDRA